MKQLLLQLHAVAAAKLQPMATILFDDAEVKTFTQEQLDASFKAGQKKAAADAAAKASSDEIAELQKFKKDTEDAAQLTTLSNSLVTDEVKELGIRAGGNAAFAEKFKDRLLGKTGATLSAEIKAIKGEENNAFYFETEDNPQAGKSLIEAAKGGITKKPKVEYYPRSSVRKR